MQMLGGLIFYFFLLRVSIIFFFSLLGHFGGHYGVGETGSANGTPTDFRQVRNLYSDSATKQKTDQKKTLD